MIGGLDLSRSAEKVDWRLPRFGKKGRKQDSVTQWISGFAENVLLSYQELSNIVLIWVLTN